MSYGPAPNRRCAEESGKEPCELHSKINCVKLQISVKWKQLCVAGPAVSE